MSKSWKKSKYKPINFYESKDVLKHSVKSFNPNYKEHNIKLFFNGLIIGSTGAGKTNILLGLITIFKNTFNHIYIFTKVEEELYSHLERVIDNSLITIKYGYDEFKKFDENEYYGQSLVIFDDMVAEKKQKEIEEHFIRGRKLSSTKGGGCCSLYLAQSYFAVPTMIRNQCDIIFIVKVPSIKNLQRIMAEYSLGGTKEQIQNMYNYCCVNSEFGEFLLINMKAKQNETYRKNYAEYLLPSYF